METYSEWENCANPYNSAITHPHNACKLKKHYEGGYFKTQYQTIDIDTRAHDGDEFRSGGLEQWQRRDVRYPDSMVVAVNDTSLGFDGEKYLKNWLESVNSGHPCQYWLDLLQKLPCKVEYHLKAA